MGNHHIAQIYDLQRGDVAGEMMVGVMAFCFSVCVVSFTTFTVAGIAKIALDAGIEVKNKAANFFKT